MKNVLRNSFWYLVIIYTAVIVLITFGLFSQYALQFNILALVIGIIGAFTFDSKQKSTKTYYALVLLAFILIFLLRAIPYFNNSIPLGYDPGFYKYAIESNLGNLDNWIINQVVMEPGFLYLMKPLSFIFSTQFIMTWLLVIACLFLGAGVYFVTKSYSNTKTAIIALFIYALSIVQFKAFWYMYYRNIIGMTLMLFSIYFLKKSETNKKFIWIFIMLGGLLGSIHRPSFYIFGLSYLLYAFISPYENKKYNFNQLKRNILSGIGIIIIAVIPYIGQFWPALYSAIPWVVEGFLAPGESAGTFINFTTYQFSSLFYLPFAFLGLFYFIRKRNFNMLTLWAIINLAIVYFQFFFFNRFIIMLDLVLVIFAAVGFSLLIENKNKFGTILTIILLLSAGAFAVKESIHSKPLIDDIELQEISSLATITPKNAFVMSTSAYYSPWIQGYSERKTIAPGLFDYDNHTRQEWNVFWTTTNLTEMRTFLNTGQKPLYIFIGKRQRNNLAQFENTSCFNLKARNDNNFIYQYLC
jgi:hypothetical protein